MRSEPTYEERLGNTIAAIKVITFFAMLAYGVFVLVTRGIIPGLFVMWLSKFALYTD